MGVIILDGGPRPPEATFDEIGKRLREYDDYRVNSIEARVKNFRDETIKSVEQARIDSLDQIKFYQDAHERIMANEVAKMHLEPYKLSDQLVLIKHGLKLSHSRTSELYGLPIYTSVEIQTELAVKGKYEIEKVLSRNRKNYFDVALGLNKVEFVNHAYLETQWQKYNAIRSELQQEVERQKTRLFSFNREKKVSDAEIALRSVRMPKSAINLVPTQLGFDLACKAISISLFDPNQIDYVAIEELNESGVIIH